MCVRDQRSEFGDQGEVLLHVRGQHHLHDKAPEHPLLGLGQPMQEVAVQALVQQQPGRQDITSVILYAYEYLVWECATTQ